MPLTCGAPQQALRSIYANAILSAREAALESKSRSDRLWSQSFTIDNMLDTMESMITSPPSQQTLDKLNVTF